MKAILTVAMALGLLMTAASADIPAEQVSKDSTMEQHEKNIENCTQNLEAIGKAIHAYQKEQGDFPEWLSDLHPKYFEDVSILVCPADKDSGQTNLAMNTDPKMLVSYDYQFHPEYREWKSEQLLMYGDAMPLVRCRHHANPDFHSLNLSFSSKIYRSSMNWEHTPEDIYGSLEEAIATLDARLQQHPDTESFFGIYPLLIRLYMKAERKEDAERLINGFKSVMKQGIQGYRMLFDTLNRMERYEDLLEIFKEAEQQHPDAQPILWRLSHIHKKLGNIELAEVYERKADPTYELIGKPVPDFSATDLDGNPISLQDYRGKVVLLDFWAVWCGFCIVEMPNLKKVYETYKDVGFDVIAVSLDNEETELRDYIKENDIPWRQIYSEEGWDSPVVQQYGITGIPEQWLIDREGKLISHKARGEALERLVAEALKDKPANE